MRKLALPFLLLPLALAACGEEGGGAGLGDKVPVDPAYFANQLFECGEPGVPPSCPPFSCEVDQEGRVVSCDSVCNDRELFDCTVFMPRPETPVGLDFCVPTECVVNENGSPECSDDCSEDDVTCYIMTQFRLACGA